MKKLKYPEKFHKIFINQKKRKSNNKKFTSKNKTCKNFCKKVFLPERERIEMEYTRKNKMKYTTPTKLVKQLYLKSCSDIYCQKKCQGSKRKWLKSFTKKRKDKLIQQGAISGCRDLHKEQPEYYKNV